MTTIHNPILPGFHPDPSICRVGFTGAFVGMACQDLAGRGGFADFEWFEYRPEITR